MTIRKLICRAGTIVPMTLLLVQAGCGGSRSTPKPAPAPARAPARTTGAAPATAAGPEFDGVKLSRDLGLLARCAPMPFVGNAAYLTSSSMDSTHVIVAITIANGNLTFGRETDRFRAGYTVSITLRNGAETVKQIEAHESDRHRIARAKAVGF